ncbi:MAG: hypothetical protein ISR87_00660 [Candidatus Marinimicrobia bacterium]|nr:hypothetical protein [FCB group bacterium]MBL7023936.1 hypothetical protein [Candidatus Neomarinimicrobiota bacterium]
MKKFLIGLISVVSIFGLLSCENVVDPQNSDFGDNSLAKHQGGGHDNIPCPAEGEFAGLNELNSDFGVYNYTLWADKNIDVGTVSITNDDENVYVTYTTDETVELEKIHVFVWTSLDDISNKRPSPGHADYSANHINAFTYTAVIPAETFCDGSFYITADAKVKCIAEDDDEDDDEDDNEDDGEDEDEDEDCDHHGNSHHGHGHHHTMRAYAGDAASPACFEEAGKKWWSYLSYTSSCFASISGNVYEDVNSSGGFDVGDAGFEGLTVTASGSDGNLYTTVTAADGSYLFEHLQTGLDYTVISDTPAGDFEADENAGGYILANLVGDESQVNFGFYLALILSDCGTSETLYASTGLDAGLVSIANDEDNLYITFDTNDEADLGEVHLEINPTFRNFGDPSAYNANSYIVATDLPADNYTITIPFADTGLTCADLFIVKAHAVLTVDATSGSNTLVGASAFGSDTYRYTKAGYYGDIEYYSCCPSAGPQ